MNTQDQKPEKETLQSIDPVEKVLTPAQKLLQKDVTRKEFVSTVGAGLVTVMGFSSIIHFLTGYGKQHRNVSSGYGSGPYGV